MFDIGSLEAELFWQKHRRTIFFSGAAAIIAVLAAALWLFAQYRARHAAQALCRCPESSRLAGSHCEISRFASGKRSFRLPSLCAPRKLKESSSEMRGLPVGISWKHAGAWSKAGPRGESCGGRANAGIPRSHAGAAGKGSSELCRPLCSAPEGRALVRMGKLEEARKVLSQLVSTYPQSPPGRTAGAQLDALAPFLSPDSQSPLSSWAWHVRRRRKA